MHPRQRDFDIRNLVAVGIVKDRGRLRCDMLDNADCVRLASKGRAAQKGRCVDRDQVAVAAAEVVKRIRPGRRAVARPENKGAGPCAADPEIPARVPDDLVIPRAAADRVIAIRSAPAAAAITAIASVQVAIAAIATVTT